MMSQHPLPLEQTQSNRLGVSAFRCCIFKGPFLGLFTTVYCTRENQRIKLPLQEIAVVISVTIVEVFRPENILTFAHTNPIQAIIGTQND